MSKKLIIIGKDCGKEVNPKELTFKRYRKKPVIIKARKMHRPFEVETLEGVMKGNIGDWLIIGVNGEMYPCKPDIFKKTYEEVKK